MRRPRGMRSGVGRQFRFGGGFACKQAPTEIRTTRDAVIDPLCCHPGNRKAVIRGLGVGVGHGRGDSGYSLRCGRDGAGVTVARQHLGRGVMGTMRRVAFSGSVAFSAVASPVRGSEPRC